MTAYFSLTTINGTSCVLFRDKITDAPIGADTLDLPEQIRAVKIDGSDVMVGIPHNIAFFLISPILEAHGYPSENSASLMLEKIGVKIDPSVGHTSPQENTYGIQKGDRVKSLGNGMVMIERPHTSSAYSPPQESFADSEGVRFRVQKVTIDGTPEIRVGIHIKLDDGTWTSYEDLDYFTDAPSFLRDEADGWALSNLSEQETRGALLSLGWEDYPKIFIGYTPQELEFGVLPDDDDDGYSLHEGLCIFVNIITPHSLFGDHPPYEDDLRPGHLIVCPEFILGDTMENTFEILPGMTKEEVIKEMTALGFTYNAEIEDYYS